MSDELTTPQYATIEAHQALDTAYNQAITRILAPPPVQTVTEWANSERWLSEEGAAEPGKYSSDRAPYQAKVMDVIGDPRWRKVVLMFGSQLGKSTIIQNALGYSITRKPGPILIVLPTIGFATSWSKNTLASMIRDTPSLQHLIPKSRSSTNTVLQKLFLGGFLLIVGANAPTNLAGWSIRDLFLDEVDRFPQSAGTEGDPIELAIQRTVTFQQTRKVVIASTPGLEETSRIEPAYKESAQHKYLVPCPHCDVMQELLFRTTDELGQVFYHITTDKDVNDQWDYATTRYVCKHCGCLIEEADKPEMLERGEWTLQNPTYNGESIGFHLNALYSFKQTWADIAREFHQATESKNRERLKKFVNCVLAESWSDRGEKVEAHKLMDRLEPYEAEVPAGVGMLSAGVDVQSDRIEVWVHGWGKDLECWIIHKEVLLGNPNDDTVWQLLGPALTRTYKTVAGTLMRVQIAAIDHGYCSHKVEAFARAFKGCWLRVVKGEDGADKPIITRPSKAKMGVFKPYIVGIHKCKDELYDRWKMGIPEGGGPVSGPRSIHLPQDVTEADLEQLTAEDRRLRYTKSGRPIVEWWKPKHKANEALDCWIYSYAAIKSLGVGWEQKIGQMALKPVSAIASSEPSEQPPQVPVQSFNPNRQQMPFSVFRSGRVSVFGR